MGDIVKVESVEGRTLTYRVDRLDVIDEHDLSVTEQRGIDQLTLVTCWPLSRPHSRRGVALRGFCLPADRWILAAVYPLPPPLKPPR